MERASERASAKRASEHAGVARRLFMEGRSWSVSNKQVRMYKGGQSEGKWLDIGDSTIVNRVRTADPAWTQRKHKPRSISYLHLRQYLSFADSTLAYRARFCCFLVPHYTTELVPLSRPRAQIVAGNTAVGGSCSSGESL